jgi:hypothetical protein
MVFAVIAKSRGQRNLSSTPDPCMEVPNPQVWSMGSHKSRSVVCALLRFMFNHAQRTQYNTYH